MCLIIHNVPWHSQQTEDSKLPNRSSRKEIIQDWLDRNDIECEPFLTKSELLEIGAKFVLPRRFEVST